ncbi:LolA family protein [Zunongwangia endophytica]|uniref:Outer membrane lipoprotein carrier protein LolA n=1 Tax=Zunongwangia endophytica TaxID=1808945 RepID=A0ABV8HFX3_9FLAO|nr:outer membrane lipoprotein carrier protein LolA [Zunongwangia endophytica]MDN3593977.1 outer membrane lipoprotein carrier protein LolA [Zunongwangia endophytica]
MRILSIILFFWSFGMFAQSNNFTSVSLKRSSQLTEKMESAKSLYGEFEQTKVMKMMDAESTSYGKIYYKSPDIIKWEYTKPFPYSLLFKDNFLYIDDDGHKSKQDMSSNKMFAKLGDLITGSLNGKLLKDDEHFDVEYQKKNNLVEAVISPKDKSMADMFEKVIMSFSEDKMLQSVKLVEESGDYTLISFQNWEMNKTIKAAVFQP